jgi:hypothetical protein
MPEELTQYQAKDSYKGVFDDYTIMGARFENASGVEIRWGITASRNLAIDPIHDHEYWVAGENFYSAIFHTGSPFRLIQIHQTPITENIELAERKAVLKAIAEWSTSPEHS